MERQHRHNTKKQRDYETNKRLRQRDIEKAERKRLRAKSYINAEKTYEETTKTETN